MMITALAALSLLASDIEAESTQAALFDVELQLREEMPALQPGAFAARMELLGALRGYAEAGVFPHNHESATPVPLFIDSHDTPCAVAFLVIASGHADLARSIAAENNHILLPADDGRISAWAAEHGFTIAELMRIQRPGYKSRETDELVQKKIAQLLEKQAMKELERRRQARPKKPLTTPIVDVRSAEAILGG